MSVGAEPAYPELAEGSNHERTCENSVDSVSEVPVTPALPHGKPVKAEHSDFVPRPTVQSQLSDNFTHNAAELESVTGKACRNHHVGMLRMVVHDEVTVRRIGEHACFQRHRGPHAAG